MKFYVDARGKQCPIPVVETRKVLEKIEDGDLVETLVDNEIAVQNLLKMAKQKKLKASEEKHGERDYRVTFSKEGKGTIGGEASKSANLAGEEEAGTDWRQPCKERSSHVLAAISSDKMGEGDEKLGKVLMKGFLYALTGLEIPPSTILLYNGGARLSVEGSAVLEDLKKLEDQGTEILTCGTCLNHYGLTEKLAVGKITDMYTICEKMTQADKVVKP